MKRISIVVALAVLIFTGGIWVGRSTPPKQSIKIEGYICGVSCGGGNYAKQTFERLNEEIPQKLDALLGGYMDSANYLVVVAPFPLGYTVRMAGPVRSRLWDSAIKNKLAEWIDVRIEEIESDIDNKAEQAGADQPATKPADKPPVKDQPSTPTSKDGPR